MVLCWCSEYEKREINVYAIIKVGSQRRVISRSQEMIAHVGEVRMRLEMVAQKVVLIAV